MCGQYWIPVSLDRKEFVQPHKLGAGLKLWEQLAAHPGTGAALIILCAAMPQARGGGDLDLSENWHGPEREFPQHNITPGPMPESYATIAKRTIGRWAGNRIALVGDYAEDSDLPEEFHAKTIYDRCPYNEKERKERIAEGVPESELYTDVSEDVAHVIEHELHGKFSDKDGWRHWTTGNKAATKAIKPDMVLGGNPNVVFGGGADGKAAMSKLFGFLEGAEQDG
jgi:hypothetical protein